MPPTPNLPTPDFTFDPNAPGACIAACGRFATAHSARGREIGSKFIVHSYGHGGAGITLSWGCAAKVADLVKTRVTSSHDTKVAVLGAGVMGMTAASRLLDLNLGLTVTIYAKDVWQNTTSAVAGGQWAVSKVNFKKDAAGKEQSRQIPVEAFTTFKNNSNFGVSELPNFNGAMSPNLETVLSVAPSLLPPRIDLDRPRRAISKPATRPTATRAPRGWARPRSPTASARSAWPTRSPEPSSSAVRWWSSTQGRPPARFPTCTSSTSCPPTRSGRTRPIFPPTSSSPPAPRAPAPSPRCRR